MSVKPTHLRQLAALLEGGDFADAAEAAKAVINKVDELRSADIPYTVVRQYPGPVYVGYGPYPTRYSAQQAIEKGRCGLAGAGMVAIIPVKSPKAVDVKFKEIDQLGDHIKGSHWALIREKVGI